MILQNLANSSYFKVTGPLTSIQGSANTVARNVPKATALLLYCFNTDKKIYFRSAGVVTVVWLTPPQARALQYGAGTDWEVAELGLCCCSHPAQLGWDRELGRARKAESFSPTLNSANVWKHKLSAGIRKDRQEHFWTSVIRVRAIVTWNKLKYSYEVKYKSQNFLLTYPILVHAKATVIVVSYLPSWHSSFYTLGVAGLQKSDQIHYGHKWSENYKMATKLT